MQIGTLLAEIHNKNTDLIYIVAAQAPQNTQFWWYCVITHLHREKARPVSPNASHSWFKHLDSLHIYSIGAAIRKNDEWNSLDGPKWRHTLTSVQIQCTVRWNYARWGQIWTYKKKKKKKKTIVGAQALCLHVGDMSLHIILKDWWNLRM